MSGSGPYTDEVMKHFKEPHNYGKMENPDAVGKVGNVVCGDVMWLSIKVGKNDNGQEIIQDIKFETFGCVAALATSSCITDLANGKTLEEAIAISKGEVVNSLGGLPRPKVHCSLLAVDALSEAVHNYLSKTKKPIPEELQQRHERIEREKNIIEEKYKDWIDTEEKMHEEGA